MDPTGTVFLSPRSSAQGRADRDARIGAGLLQRHPLSPQNRLPVADAALGVSPEVHRSRRLHPVVGARTVAPHQRSLAPRAAPEAKKNAIPSAAIIDSQSVKCADTVATGSSGYDAGKKIKGRKRHLLTDTQGLLLGVHVSPASVQDRDGAKVLFCLFCHLFLTVTLIFADGGYQGQLEAWVRQMGFLFGHRSLALEIIKRSDKAKGFELLPRRWVVERTFGWLMKSRRLTRDHERKPSHHEAFVYLAMIGFATRRLTQ